MTTDIITSIIWLTIYAAGARALYVGLTTPLPRADFDHTNRVSEDAGRATAGCSA